MATCNPNQTSSDIEEYLRELLECPVCMETIKSVPVYQCANGHVICMDCIEKLNNCPICRNDSELRRSLKLENIVQRLEGIQRYHGTFYHFLCLLYTCYVVHFWSSKLQLNLSCTSIQDVLVSCNFTVNSISSDFV